MLTIKPPIQLRCRFPMETVHNDLAEKIMGNYTLMNNFIRKEELLYVTTQAPEVYFAEGNNISILNDIKNENKQEIRLDVINHLINRILMSHTDNFSYQDTVYISNVLRKLGIQDVSNFMKQVYRLQEEKNENNQLIDIYEEQKNILINIFKEEEKKQSKDKSNDKKEKTQYENKYYLHDEIFNRLNTKNVYEDMRNYTQGIESLTKKITNNEIAISEQVSMIQNFNLHKLKKEIINNDSPIYYYHANQYELAENDNVEVQDSEARISAAILLNLVDNIYSLRLNQIENNSHNWYSVAGALFKSAENTWKRYETNHKEGKKVYSDMYNTMVDIVNSKKNEKNIINNIVNEINTLNVEKSEAINQDMFDEIFIRNNINNVIKEAIFNSDENIVFNSLSKVFNIKQDNQENRRYIENLTDELKIIKNEIRNEDIKVIKKVSEIVKQTKNLDINNEFNEEIISKVKNEIINMNPDISTFMYNGLIEVINNNTNDNRIISNIINEISILNEHKLSGDDSEIIDETTVINNIQNTLDEVVYYNNERLKNDIVNQIFNNKRINQDIINHSIDELVNQIEVNNHFIYDENIKLINSLSDIVEKNNKTDITYQNIEKIINDIRTEIIDNKPSVMTNMYSGLVEVVNNSKEDVTIISDIINDIRILNEQRILDDNSGTEDKILINKVKNKLENFVNYNYDEIENKKNVQRINKQSTSVNVKSNDIEKISNEISYVNNNIYNEDVDIISRLNSIVGQTDITVMNNSTTENIINNLNNEFNINNSGVNTSYESISELIHTENISEEENVKNITEITEETLKHFDEINRKNIENYKKMLEIENRRPKVKNVSLNKERARADALRALENPQEVLMEIVNSENKDEHNEVNIKLDEQIYNLFSDETKNIFEQIVMQKNGEVPSQFTEQTVIHRAEEKEDVQDIVNNVINKEFINEVVNRQNISNTSMIQKPSITYEINETIKNEINELRNMGVINLYENYFGKEEEVKTKRVRKSKAVIEKEKKKERESLELKHFMNQAEMEESIVGPVKPQVQRTSNVGMVHKIEEQVITEELLNTIRNKTVDNAKEETFEHNQIHNINKNEKTINETVNQIKVSNQDNIEEIVKQNVKKQLNQLTDQVYGKIEKKLQTERKRRGY